MDTAAGMPARRWLWLYCRTAKNTAQQCAVGGNRLETVSAAMGVFRHWRGGAKRQTPYREHEGADMIANVGNAMIAGTAPVKAAAMPLLPPESPLPMPEQSLRVGRLIEGVAPQRTARHGLAAVATSWAAPWR